MSGKFISCAVLVLILSAFFCSITFGEGTNLIKNPGFEEITGDSADGWSTMSFDTSPGAAEFIVDKGGAYSGSICLTINNKKPNDSKAVQYLDIEPGEIYKVSCRIRTEGISQQAGSANITLMQGRAIYTSLELSDTGGEWQKLEFQITSLKDFGNALTFMLRLGGQGTLNKGKASFDDISVELMKKQDASIPLQKFYIPPEDNPGASSVNTGQGNGNGASGSGNTLIYIFVGIAVVALIVFIEVRFAKRDKNKPENKDDNEYEIVDFEGKSSSEDEDEDKDGTDVNSTDDGSMDDSGTDEDEDNVNDDDHEK
jgi:hypothetical protein